MITLHLPDGTVLPFEDKRNLKEWYDINYPSDSKCWLDNQHGIKLSENDYQAFLKAEEECKKRNPQFSKLPLQDQECDVVLAYARMKVKG